MRLRTERRKLARQMLVRYNETRGVEAPKLKLRDIWPLFVTIHTPDGFYTPPVKGLTFGDKAQ